MTLALAPLAVCDSGSSKPSDADTTATGDGGSPSGHGGIDAGRVAKSASYRMVFTLGVGSRGSESLTSPNNKLRVVVADALRDALERETVAGRGRPVRTHTFAGQGLQPGLSWDDWSTLRDLAYEGRGA